MGEEIISTKRLGVENVALGKIRINNKKITLLFKNGKKIMIDDLPNCCEKRYFRTDDNLRMVGGSFLCHIAIKPARVVERNDKTVHEVTFIEIMTSKGFITICSHNEHNGYYSGCRLRIQIEGKNRKMLDDFFVKNDECEYD